MVLALCCVVSLATEATYTTRVTDTSDTSDITHTSHITDITDDYRIYYNRKPASTRFNLNKASQTLSLSMKFVVETVIKNSLEYKHISFKQSTLSLPVLVAIQPFNWEWDFKLKRQSTLQDSVNADLGGKGSQLGNVFQDKWVLSSEVNKKFLTGTKLSVKNSYFSIDANNTGDNSENILQFGVEQDILRNIFGLEDQWLMDVAKARLSKAQMQLSEDTEALIVQAVRQFWNTCLSQLSLKLKQFKKRDYTELVRIARTKRKYKYLQPGELNQMRAELEFARQEVVLQTAHYKDELKRLFNLLNLKKPVKLVHCQIDKKVSKPPGFKAPKVTPRLVAKMKEELRIKENELAIEKSKSLPSIKLFSSYDIGGKGKDSYDSWQRLKNLDSSGYDIGIRLNYSFPNYSILKKNLFIHNQEVEAGRVDLKLAQQEFDRLLSLTKIHLDSLQSAVKSSGKVYRLRALSYKEIRKAYLQGRLNVFSLITAREFAQQSEMENIELIAKYYIELTKAYALTDQLIARYIQN